MDHWLSWNFSVDKAGFECIETCFCLPSIGIKNLQLPLPACFRFPEGLASWDFGKLNLWENVNGENCELSEERWEIQGWIWDFPE